MEVDEKKISEIKKLGEGLCCPDCERGRNHCDCGDIPLVGDILSDKKTGYSMGCLVTDSVCKICGEKNG